MSRDAFDRLRAPIAIGLGVLMVLAGYLFVRGVDSGPPAIEPSPSVVVGQPAGGVVMPSPSESAAATAVPTATVVLTPPPTPTPAPSPTPAPPPPSDFTAEVKACRTISGPQCVGEIQELESDDQSFVALVLFDNAVAGDVMNAILSGPGGTVEGGAYALTGSGRGYYYSTIPVGGLPEGGYTLSATRNGQEVARTELRKDD